jgi:SulP family sulfate permease
VLPFINDGNPLALVFQFTLMVGIIRMAMGFLRLGWLVEFVPEPAFLGFMVGTGVLIALGQPHHLLGVQASTQHAFLPGLLETLGHVRETNLYSLAIGIATFTLVFTFDRYAKKLPVALAVMVAATAITYALGESAGVRLVRDITAVPNGLPELHAYPVNLAVAKEMLPGALSVSAIGLIEAVLIGQSLALKYRQHLNFNQEFFGQGLSQVVGAFFLGFPGSGSFSRSALIEQTGGQTRMANVYFGLFTALALLLIPRWLDIIPVPALAGLLLFAGYKLIDVPRMRQVWNTSRSDAAVMMVTFFVTVFVKIEYGFFAGIVMAMAFFLNKARSLQLYELVPQKEDIFKERLYVPGSVHEPSDIVALAVHGNLFFGLAHDLRDQLNEIVRVQDPRFIIIRTRRAYSIDYSCWSAIFQFAQAFQEQEGRLYLTGVRPDLIHIIKEAGMSDVLPPDQVIALTGSPFGAIHKAVLEVYRHLTPDTELSRAWVEYVRYVLDNHADLTEETPTSEETTGLSNGLSAASSRQHGTSTQPSPKTASTSLQNSGEPSTQ